MFIVAFVAAEIFLLELGQLLVVSAHVKSGLLARLVLPEHTLDFAQSLLRLGTAKEGDQMIHNTVLLCDVANRPVVEHNLHDGEDDGNEARGKHAGLQHDCGVDCPNRVARYTHIANRDINIFGIACPDHIGNDNATDRILHDGHKSAECARIGRRDEVKVEDLTDKDHPSKFHDKISIGYDVQVDERQQSVDHAGHD